MNKLWSEPGRVEWRLRRMNRTFLELANWFLELIDFDFNLESELFYSRNRAEVHRGMRETLAMSEFRLAAS